MIKEFLEIADIYNSHEHIVKELRLSKSGSKYHITAYFNDRTNKIIGRYNTYTEAKTELKKIQLITKGSK